MSNLADLSASPLLKLLLIGDSGAGKTTFLASMPKPWLADFDGKVVSAASYLRKANPEQLKLVQYESYVGLPTGTAAEKLNRDLGAFGKQTPFPFETIGVDSLTTFSDESMKYLIRMNPGIKRADTKVMQIPAQQDYQMARLWFKQIITGVLALPCHVVFTAHIQTEKDETTGAIVRSAMMAGKLAHELPIYFGEVWRAYVNEKGEHWAQTKSDHRFTCRSQIPGLPNPVRLDWNEIKKYLV